MARASQSKHRHSTVRTIVTRYLFNQGRESFQSNENNDWIFRGLGLFMVAELFGVLETRAPGIPGAGFLCLRGGFHG